MSTRVSCGRCAGSGRFPRRPCDVCDGTGVRRWGPSEACTVCGGSGVLDPEACYRCAGRGWAWRASDAERAELDALGLSTRTRTIAVRYGASVSVLARTTDADLLGWRHLGRTALAEIRALVPHDPTVAEELPEVAPPPGWTVIA